MGAFYENWAPQVGLLVCDCWFNHQKIVAINPVDEDLVTLEDGLVCSFLRCCTPADDEHPFLSPMPDDWQPVCAYLLNRDGVL